MVPGILYNTKSQEIEKIILDKVNLKMQLKVTNSCLLQGVSIEQIAQDTADKFVFELRGYLYGKNYRTVMETIKYPSNWVEAMKDAFLPPWFPSLFPKWMRGFFEVRYIKKEISITETYICPHLNTVSNKEHIEFILRK